MHKGHTALYLTLALGLAACGTQILTGNPQPTVNPQGITADATTGNTDAPEGLAAQLPAYTTDYAIITFKSPPAAQYRGGIRGLAPTKPERGKKLDPNSPAVRAYLKFLENEQASYRAYLARVAPQAALVRDYTLTLNGVAVKTNGASLEALRRGPNVKDAAYSTLYRPTMNRSLSQIGVTDTWRATTGLNGADVKVGVIDSGIDESHPFFECKSDILSKVYASGVAGFGPDIVDSHGTHVAGTIAGCVTTLDADDPLAGQTISGVAPAATLFDYNVFPGFGGGYVAFGGSAFSHDIADAVEDAVADGMDVVNMSLGGSVQGPNDFLQEAVNAAVDAGVVFTVSAGNSGPDGYTIGSPGSAENAITVGAVTNSHYVGVKIGLYDGEEKLRDIGGAAGEFDPFTKDNAVTGKAMAIASPNLACTTIDPNVAGKIAIIDRGTCAFSVKVSNAEAAGAIGVLVVNNQPGDPIAMATSPVAVPPQIPALMISLEDGDALKALLNDPATDDVTASIDGENREEIITENGGMLALFSSRGPTAFTGIIKPDVVAPGANIYSSVLGDTYEMYSGTSMAAPHVAGAAALLLQQNRDWSPFDVKAALATTARRTDKLESSIAGADLKVAARGSGLIDVPAALNVPVLVSPSNVSFGYHNPGGKSKAVSVVLTVRSVGGAPVDCSVSSEGSVLLSSTRVTADPDGTLTVTLENPSGRTGDEEGYIALTCDGVNLYVPWASYLNRPGQG